MCAKKVLALSIRTPRYLCSVTNLIARPLSLAVGGRSASSLPFSIIPTVLEAENSIFIFLAHSSKSGMISASRRSSSRLLLALISSTRSSAKAIIQQPSGSRIFSSESKIMSQNSGPKIDPCGQHLLTDDVKKSRLWMHDINKDRRQCGERIYNLCTVSANGWDE